MPRNGTKNLTSEEKIDIVVRKETTSKSLRKIAKEIGRAPSTVCGITYESLSADEKAIADDAIGEIRLQAGMAVVAGLQALQKCIEAVSRDPDPKYLSSLSNALRTAFEIHQISSNSATEIVEHRSPISAAKAAMKRIMDTGRFSDENVPEVAEIVARKYGVKPRLLVARRSGHS